MWTCRNGVNARCVIAIVLVRLASIGTKVDQSKLEQFEIGSTTRTQVIAALGKPDNNTINSDGSSSMLYYYSQTQTRPENFLPYVGLFVGGYDTEQTQVKFDFDKRRVLTSYEFKSG